MDNSLIGSDQNLNTLEQLLGLYPTSVFPEVPFMLNPFELHESTVGAFPLSPDHARQNHAALGDDATIQPSNLKPEKRLEALNGVLELMPDLSTSSLSTYSQEAPTRCSLGETPIRIFQSLTPSCTPSNPVGSKLSNEDHPSSQLTDLNMSILDDELFRPFMTPHRTPGLVGNTLHLLTTPPVDRTTDSESFPFAFEFNSQVNRSLVSYPSSSYNERLPTAYVDASQFPDAIQPERFYPTPTSTPQHAISLLPRRSEEEMGLSSLATPTRLNRPVRAAAIAAKRKVSFADVDDDEDDFELSTQRVSKRRKAPSSTSVMHSTLTYPVDTGRRAGPKTSEKNKQQKKCQKDAKTIWEEDRTVDPGTPVVCNGKIFDGCQWGVPVYAVCRSDGSRSIRWRCSSCFALLGRRPDLHRHWKSCVENAIFVCDEVIHEDGSAWPGCGTVCSRQDAARRHIERRFKNGHCSLSKPNKANFPTIEAYEKRLATYNDMLMNSARRAALPISEKNRLAHLALVGMKTDIFKD